MEHDEVPRRLPVTIEDRGDHVVATATDPEVVNAHLLAPGMTMVVGQRGELIVQAPTVQDVLAVLDGVPDASDEVRDAAIAGGWARLFPPERQALTDAGMA
jgi:hypothetical protein